MAKRSKRTHRPDEPVDPSFNPHAARTIMSRVLDAVLDEFPDEAQQALEREILFIKDHFALFAAATPAGVKALNTLRAAGFEQRTFVFTGTLVALLEEDRPPMDIALAISMNLLGRDYPQLHKMIGQAALFGYLLGAGGLNHALAEYGGYSPPSPLDELIING